MNTIELLRLLPLSDSAAPIGGTAHSFGLEMMIALGQVAADNIHVFLGAYLEESALMDAVFCRAAWFHSNNDLLSINDDLSALRTSRELREASISLGRRLLRLCYECDPRDEFEAALGWDLHHAIAFGLISRVLTIDPETAVAAFIHQSCAALISASQRLIPLGQYQASRILWELKPQIAEVAEASSRLTPGEVSSFTPMIEVASMRHRRLETRLFIS